MTPLARRQSQTNIKFIFMFTHSGKYVNETFVHRKGNSVQRPKREIELSDGDVKPVQIRNGVATVYSFDGNDRESGNNAKPSRRCRRRIYRFQTMPRMGVGGKCSFGIPLRFIPETCNELKFLFSESESHGQYLYKGSMADEFEKMPMRRIKMFYERLFKNATGTKPKMTPADWGWFQKLARQRWLDTFYQEPDIMAECMRAFFKSQYAKPKDYAWRYMFHKDVMANMLEGVRDTMKRNRKWERGESGYSIGGDTDHAKRTERQEIDAMMERLRKANPVVRDLSIEALERLAISRLERTM